MRAYEHRVRYHEADAQQIVFNSRYLEFCDVACTEYLRLLGWSLDELAAIGVDLVVAKAELQFRAPARFDEVLAVDVSCPRLGTSSLDLAFAITRDGAAIADAIITYVNVGASGSVPLPQAVRDRLSAA